jgi:hypothetical protein
MVRVMLLMSGMRQLGERYDSGKNRREGRAGVALIIIVTIVVADAMSTLMQR